MQPRERLIFPLDVPNKTEAERFISLLKDHVGLFKVGLELFVAEGPAFLQFLTETARVEYFLDLKFHDIPATVTERSIPDHGRGQAGNRACGHGPAKISRLARRLGKTGSSSWG